MSAVAVAIGTGTALKVYGGLRAGAAAKGASEAQASEMENKAAQLEQYSGQAIAAAQRKALEQKRITDLMASRSLAYAAAGGGGASDKSVVHIISDLKGEGSYRAMLAMYEGEDTARKLNYQATLDRSEAGQLRKGGEAKLKAAKISAVGDIISGATSMYSKFNPAATEYNGNYNTSPAQYAGGYSYTDPNDYVQAKKYGLVR